MKELLVRRTFTIVVNRKTKIASKLFVERAIAASVILRPHVVRHCEPTHKV